MTKHQLVKLESSKELELVPSPDIDPCLWGLFMDDDFDGENIEAINTLQILENIPSIQRYDPSPPSRCVQGKMTVVSDRFLAIDDEYVDQFNKENENKNTDRKTFCPNFVQYRFKNMYLMKSLTWSSTVMLSN